METGLDYFGDRYYDSWSGTWLTLDPMGSKYPSWSGYSYCFDEPVGNVDPQGDTVWVSYNNEKVMYTAGMKYTGKNKTIASIISSLNSMNSVKIGSKVLSTLISSSGNYDYTLSDKGFGDFEANKNGLGGTMNLDANWNGNIEEVAHEAFHGYMYDQGSGLSSVTNEVEAYLYGAAVSYSLGMNPQNFGAAGSAYDNAMMDLVFASRFNGSEFGTAVKFFKSQSFANSTHKYDNFVKVHPEEKFLIKQFYPLWR